MEPYSIFVFALTFSIIIFIHELGHYLACVWCNIPVKEFGIGFPPKAVKLFTWRGTDFTLNWLPIGGFVKPAGEDDSSVADGLSNAPKLKRIFVLVAGAGMNFILAFGLLFAAYRVGEPINHVFIAKTAPNSPAAQAGLQADDWVVQAAGKPIEQTGDLYAITQAHLGKPMTLEIERQGSRLTIELTPRVTPPEGQGALGIEMRSVPQSARKTADIMTAVRQSLRDMGSIAWQVISLPASLITRQVKVQDFVGIVGMKAISDQVVDYAQQTSSIFPILFQAALLNMAIGMTNLLPLPALDGGRILFVLIEAIRGKRIPPEREGIVHLVGMAMLLMLSALLVVQDLQKFYLK